MTLRGEVKVKRPHWEAITIIQARKDVTVAHWRR